jgi:hypothetical protein
MKERALLQDVIQLIVEDGKEIEIPVYGLSMFPFLRPGNIVRIKKTAFEDFKKGDLIVFQREDKLVLHRVVKTSCSFIESQGDSLLRRDSPIFKGTLVAVVTSYKRKLRFYKVKSAGFRFYAQFILWFGFCIRYVFHPVSFIWYKFIGQKIE